MYHLVLVLHSIVLITNIIQEWNIPDTGSRGPVGCFSNFFGSYLFLKLGTYLVEMKIIDLSLLIL